jgi:hypothetical protein
MNSVNIKIQKLIVKLIFSKKAEFRLVIELDAMITCFEEPRLYVINPHIPPIIKLKKESIEDAIKLG